MTENTAPPVYSSLVDSSGVVLLPWLLFVNNLYNGDEGQIWTPQFSGLTQVGTATFSGVFYQISKNLAYFAATITPATNTSSTAGTTYISNFPLTLKNDGACEAVSGLAGSTSGMCDRASNRIYTPGWTTITAPITICGTVEAS